MSWVLGELFSRFKQEHWGPEGKICINGRRNMQREGQIKYQTYVFQKQTRSRTQEFHSRYLHPYTACPFSLSVLELLRHSRPMEAPGIPETAGSNFIQAHTLCFQGLRPWERFLDSVLLVPGTRVAGDSPPCSQSGCIRNVWLTWVYSSSFYCNKLEPDTQWKTDRKYPKENIILRVVVMWGS